MYHSFKICASILLIAFVSSCQKIKESAPKLTCQKGIENHPKEAKYQNLINKILETGVPGVTVTVITPEGIFSEAGGKADLKNNIDMTPCHVLRVGSVSKLFCAVTILKLQDEGLLSIEDKANKYIPKSITDQVPNGNECTIKQLLNHTAGIPEYSDIKGVLGILNQTIAKRSAEEYLESIYSKKPDFAPGTGKLYSNSNFLMLALVIKHVTGKNANDVVVEKIIQPLGLENTYMSTAQPAELARGYYDAHDNGEVIDRTEIDHNAVGGQDMLDGGVMSTSYDLAVFMRALVNGEILSPISWAQMQDFTSITQDLGPNLAHLTEYGLGMMKVETNFGIGIGHYGSVHCFSGLVYHFPAQNLTVGIIRNGDSAQAKRFFESEELLHYLF